MADQSFLIDSGDWSSARVQHNSDYDQESRHSYSSVPLKTEPRLNATNTSETHREGTERESLDELKNLRPRTAPTQTHEYNYRKTRVVILTKTFCELLVTIAICVLILGTLAAFQGKADDPHRLGEHESKAFNVLIIGLSICLSLHLASSLKSYANILRWSLLTRKWYNPETFDLVLGCASQLKVLELILKAWPWPRYRTLGRNPSKLICVAGIIWIIVNLAAQVSVASLSIFWPFILSENAFIEGRGNVTVANLAHWKGVVDKPGEIRVRPQSAAANEWGMSGQHFDEVVYTQFEDEIRGPRTVYHKPGEFWEYRFDDRTLPANYSRWTNRYIRTNATCIEHSIEKIDSCAEFYTDARKEIRSSECIYLEDKDGMNPIILPENHWGDGWTTYMGKVVTSDPLAGCGDRCTPLKIFQHKDPGGLIGENTFISCRTEVSQVIQHDQSKLDYPSFVADEFTSMLMDDKVARHVAAAIGQSGMLVVPNTVYSQMVYSPVSRWSADTTINVTMMEDLVSRFAIGSIAAFNDQGPRFTLVDQQNALLPAQVLQVDWFWVGLLMAGMCALQLSAFLVVSAFANKAIIRDDSFWTVARLLMPVVSKLTSQRSTLTGFEINKASELRDERIAYGVRSTAEGKRIDVLWEGQDVLERTAFQSGMY